MGKRRVPPKEHLIWQPRSKSQEGSAANSRIAHFLAPWLLRPVPMKADVTARLVMTTKIHPSEDQNKALHSLCKDKDTMCGCTESAPAHSGLHLLPRKLILTEDLQRSDLG